MIGRKQVLDHETLYSEFFETKTTPGFNKARSCQQGQTLSWFFALLTNETMDAITALELYRNKDVVEKAFGNETGLFKNYALQTALTSLMSSNALKLPARRSM